VRWRYRHDGTYGPPRHWYRITVYECVICGRTDTNRERKYGQRPKDLPDGRPSPERYEWHQVACSGHFL